MLHFCHDTMFPSTVNEGPSGCTTFRGFSPVLQPLSCTTTHWLSQPLTASMNQILSIDKEHQQGASTRSINKEHQQGASTRSINEEHQQVASTSSINK